MSRLRALRATGLGGSCLALLGAALAGAAIGTIMHRPWASRESPVPVVAERAPPAALSSPVRARVRTAVTQLDRIRRPMRAELARARAAGERARAANEIAAAYRAAARTLAPLEVDHVAQSVPTVGLMRALWHQYQALARAATANDAAGFAATGASISGHERALAAVLARWQAAA